MESTFQSFDGVVEEIVEGGHDGGVYGSAPLTFQFRNRSDSILILDQMRGIWIEDIQMKRPFILQFEEATERCDKAKIQCGTYTATKSNAESNDADPSHQSLAVLHAAENAMTLSITAVRMEQADTDQQLHSMSILQAPTIQNAKTG